MMKGALAKADEPDRDLRCPACDSLALYRYGRSWAGKWRYLCLICSRQFTVPGRIRLHVPLLKKVDLRRVKSSGEIKIPPAEGIKKVRPNPITGSLLIEYDPSAVDIEDYIRRLISDEELVSFVKSCIKD